MTIRVFLVEPHAVVRAGLQRLLDAEPDLVVVGAAADGAGGLRGLARLRAEAAPRAADVVVAGAPLPDGGEAALTRALKAAEPGLRILWLALHDGPAQRAALLAAGADGYRPKQGAAGALTPAIRAVAAGAPARAHQQPVPEPAPDGVAAGG